MSNFLRRNIVLAVCIPTLVAIHYGWYYLQFNEEFVPKDQRKFRILGVDLTKFRGGEKASDDGDPKPAPAAESKQ